MWVGSAQITEPGINPEHSGPISAQNIFFFLGPRTMLIICRTWTVVHVLHATEMVAETGGWRRSGLLKAGVSAVIKRISWWFWQRFCEERWPESFTGRRGRLLQKWERGRNGGCFRCGGGWLVVGIARCGEASDVEADGGFGWWLERRIERERERERNCRNWVVGAGFFRLWTRFSPPSGH